MLRNLFLLLFNCYLIQSAAAQVSSTPAQELAQHAQQKSLFVQNSKFNDYPIRSIGPTVMGGRIVDIALTPQSKTFYVAFASGGLFKTQNNGITFESVFDNQGARLTIGDIAVSQANPNILWVGTGENNSSRSSYAGLGMYKSTDAGKTWTSSGLEATQHIGRIITHPTDENTLWVAAIGGLYSDNSERGVFKSTDGGKNWKKTLFINDSTGVIDLIINPKDPNQLWAAAWERKRSAWDFKENGPGSGLFYSSDAGETWTLITNGLPERKNLGRMGLDICLSQPNVLYMVLDNQEETMIEKKADKEAVNNQLNFKSFETMSSESFLALPEAEIDTFLVKNRFPKKYKASILKEDIQAGKYKPSDLSNYFKSANDALFNTQVKGAEVYRSDDYGQSWQKVNSYALESVYFTYGYYFGQVSVDPNNADKIYIVGVPMLTSDDGGKTFRSLATFAKNDHVHADHHSVIIDPMDSQHLILGNDGGVFMSYDGGENFSHLDNIPAGQFYSVFADNAVPYNVYGGLQDNGVYMGSSQSVPNETKDWESIMGGDGMYVQVDTVSNNYVYTGYQFANYFRQDRKTNKNTFITPTRNLGQDALRFNWRSPLIISKHNPNRIYSCSQYVHLSNDRGDNWSNISQDLTNKLPNGNVPYSTVSAFCESGLNPDVLIAGTDDGNVQITKDGGKTWENVSQTLPKQRWVSHVFTSPFDEGSFFVSMNGYRFDEFKTYIYYTEDFGKNWTSLKGNLPEESVNVIIQDPFQKSILYIGTELNAYISMDKGQSWDVLSNMPNVSVYDLMVHPRDKELILATHGRSMYVMDVKPIHTIVQSKSNNIIPLEVSAQKPNEGWNRPRAMYLPKSEPVANIRFFVKDEPKKQLSITIVDESSAVVKKIEPELKNGWQNVTWDLKNENGEVVKSGKYQVQFESGREKTSVELVVR